MDDVVRGFAWRFKHFQQIERWQCQKFSESYLQFHARCTT